jgi:hypothetical protein
MRLEPGTRYPKDNSTYTVYGTVWETTVCTSFDWPWLLIPVVLVLLTALALSLIMWATATDRERAPVWKSSLFPLFYAENIDTLEKLDKTAEKDLAVLEKTGGTENWQFVLMDDTSHGDSASEGTELALLPLTEQRKP